jgi:hypothetical protein
VEQHNNNLLSLKPNHSKVVDARYFLITGQEQKTKCLNGEQGTNLCLLEWTDWALQSQQSSPTKCHRYTNDWLAHKRYTVLHHLYQSATQKYMITSEFTRKYHHCGELNIENQDDKISMGP